MAIKKAVKTNPDPAAAFIAGAPDAKAPAPVKPGGVMRGNKRQITLTLPPTLLPQVDQAAEALGISRAAWITMTISKALRGE
jgi:hypothetical protein